MEAEKSVVRAVSFIRPPAAIVLIALALWFSTLTVVHGRFLMGDFKAFYCSARVLLQHEDPYAAGPIGRCESTPAPAPLFVTQPGQVLPAPLPGYAIAGFTPLALLPFAVAVWIWIAILSATTIAAIVLLSRLGVGNPWTIAVAFSLITIALCFPVGEMPPIALFGIVLAAWGAARNRTVAVGIGIALTFCEPQIGTATALAAIALGRRFALPAIVVVVTLGIVSVVAVGISGNLEYVRVVLPAHLLSELPSVLQYSLSWVLNRLGVASAPALLIGRLSWIVMLGVTVWFASLRFARAQPAFALLAAPAFAVVGGPFLHLDHIALAIPAALWLASTPRSPSWIRTASVVALSIPLLRIFAITPTLALLPFFAAWLGSAYGGGAIAGLRTALVAVLVTAGIAIACIATGNGLIDLSHTQTLPASLPQASWAHYIDTHFVYTAWTVWLVKAPTWFGVLATAWASLAYALRGYATSYYSSAHGVE